MRPLYTLFLLLCLSPVLHAQQRYNLDKLTGTPTAAATATDLTDATRLLLREQPALVGWLSSDSTERNLLQASAATSISAGDYLHHQGRHTTDATLLAGGQMSIAGVGTLYGRALYARQTQRATLLSYGTHTADFEPYLVSDTVATGDIATERYAVDGGLSLSAGRWRYGLSGAYEGLAVAKETQPRRSVYSHWFRVGLSAALTTPRLVLSAHAYPEVLRQNIGASSALEAYKFALFYGFGQFNLKESPSGFSYSRSARIYGGGLDAVAQAHGSWTVTLAAGYNYRWMQTEEATYKNLFSTRTHSLSHQLVAARQLSPYWQLHIALQGQARWRQGREGVYEQQLVNAAQHLYDYIEVGVNQLYRLSQSREQLSGQATWQARPRLALSLQAALAYDARRETYTLPSIRIVNRTLTPALTAGCRLHAGRSAVDALVSAAWQRGLSNDYQVPLPVSPTEQTMAYQPYLLRGEDHWQAALSAIYSYRLGQHDAVGLRLDASHVQRSSLPAGATPTAVSGAAPVGQRHRTDDCRVSLFYLF